LPPLPAIIPANLTLPESPSSTPQNAILLHNTTSGLVSTHHANSFLPGHYHGKALKSRSRHRAITQVCLLLDQQRYTAEGAAHKPLIHLLIKSSHGHEQGQLLTAKSAKHILESSYVSKPRKRPEAQVLAIPPPRQQQPPHKTHACCMCSTGPLPTVHTAKELRPGTPGSRMRHGSWAWHGIISM
jgi:hypothetical protein